MGINASNNHTNYKRQSLSNSSFKPASSLPSSPLDLEIEHLETFIFVWLDPRIDSTEGNRSLRKRLRSYMTFLITFDDLKLCEEWLKTRPIHEKIIFLTSGSVGENFVPNIHQLSSIIAIYIFCRKPDLHITWTQKYSKVREVISKSEKLLRQISLDQIYFENIENSKAIKIFEDRDRIRMFDSESASILWYELFLEVLTSSLYLQTSALPSELIQMLRRYSSNDDEGQNLIKEFEQTYKKKEALKWLTDNNALARFVNKALREQNISMLFYLRFFLIDVYNQLVSRRLQSASVYQKQFMSMTDIDKINAKLNQYFVLNGFLLASTERPEYLSTEINDNHLQTVFIEIDATSRDGTPPFASVEPEGVGATNDPQHSSVLFMCASIFKIISKTKLDENNWTLELSLVSERDLHILNDKKRKLRQSKDLFMIIDLLDQSNQQNKANIYCEHLIRELPSDHVLVPHLKERLIKNPKIPPVRLRTVQFVLIDLSMHLSQLASDMLNALHSLTNGSILVFDNSSDFNFDSLPDKKTVLFASKRFMSSMTKKPDQLVKSFMFVVHKDKLDQPDRFDNSEDLIFQLADELYRYYKCEADEDLKLGDTGSAKEREELANRIHSELKRVHQRFFTNDNDHSKPPICTTTALIWLQSKSNQEDVKTNMQQRFGDIFSSITTFKDEQECYGHVCTVEHDNSVFLIIDADYKDSVVAAFPELANVKKIYSSTQSSATNEMTINNHDDLYCQLAHDLIAHYNRLGSECNARKEAEKAKEMFLKAHNLCKIIMEL